MEKKLGRKCVICAHKLRKEIDAQIIEGSSSARVIGERFGVSKSNVAQHRQRHLAVELKGAHAAQAGELQGMLRAAEKLIELLKLHLERKPAEAVSLDWIRASRDLRGWLTFRAKAMAKVAPAGEGKPRGGDTFNICFVDPNGQPTRIPLKVYAALPREVFADDGEKGKSNGSAEASASDQASA